MKLITAIIQPNRLEAVKTELAKVDISRLTVADAQGYGRQRGHTEIYRGQEYTVNLLPKVKLELAVDDAQVEPAINAIVTACRTGKVGDGKIFVQTLDDCMRIRTGERGIDAL
jgi:nitrogen regulatory protein P-II 1